MATRTFDAECECYDRELKCFHTIKEKTDTLEDSTSEDIGDSRPEWVKTFAIVRNSGTQRIKFS